MKTVSGDVLSRAAILAEEAADRAGLQIVELRSPEAAQQAADLLADVWQTARDASPVSAHLLQAMAHTGNYVVGAYAGPTLLATSLAWRAGDDVTELHSHISGVSTQAQNRGVGYALKLHQRAWALERGFTTITWTVDPLVRRNILFNLSKLGAEVGDYLSNFYGAMNDGVNGTDDSDRLLLIWRLASQHAVAVLERAEPPPCPEPPGEHVLRVGDDLQPVVRDGQGAVRRYQIPADIVALRGADLPRAADWRRALRATFGKALQDGGRVVTFTRDGDYVVRLDPSLPG